MNGAEFAKATTRFSSGRSRRDGVYATNGGMFAVIKKSRQDRILPDLFCVEFAGSFRGIFSRIFQTDFRAISNYLSWIILKAHTENNAGTVTLQSSRSAATRRASTFATSRKAATRRVRILTPWLTVSNSCGASART